jgi:hypothetical protein
MYDGYHATWLRGGAVETIVVARGFWRPPRWCRAGAADLFSAHGLTTPAGRAGSRARPRARCAGIARSASSAAGTRGRSPGAARRRASWVGRHRRARRRRSRGDRPRHQLESVESSRETLPFRLGLDGPRCRSCSTIAAASPKAAAIRGRYQVVPQQSTGIADSLRYAAPCSVCHRRAPPAARSWSGCTRQPRAA